MISACSSRPSQFFIGNSGSVEHNPMMNWSLEVLTALPDALQWCMSGGSTCYSMLFSFSRSCNNGDASLSILVKLGFIIFVGRFPCRSWKTSMNSLSDLDFMGRTKMLLLSDSYWRGGGVPVGCYM